MNEMIGMSGHMVAMMKVAHDLNVAYADLKESWEAVQSHNIGHDLVEIQYDVENFFEAKKCYDHLYKDFISCVKAVSDDLTPETSVS